MGKGHFTYGEYAAAIHCQTEGHADLASCEAAGDTRTSVTTADEPIFSGGPEVELSTISDKFGVTGRSFESNVAFGLEFAADVENGTFQDKAPEVREAVMERMDYLIHETTLREFDGTDAQLSSAQDTINGWLANAGISEINVVDSYDTVDANADRIEAAFQTVMDNPEDYGLTIQPNSATEEYSNTGAARFDFQIAQPG